MSVKKTESPTLDSRLTHYLAYGPYCWGKGKTEKEAVRNMFKHYPSFSRTPKAKVGYLVFRVTESTYVGEMGHLTRKQGEPAEVELRRVNL